MCVPMGKCFHVIWSLFGSPNKIMTLLDVMTQHTELFRQKASKFQKKGVHKVALPETRKQTFSESEKNLCLRCMQGITASVRFFFLSSLLLSNAKDVWLVYGWGCVPPLLPQIERFMPYCTKKVQNLEGRRSSLCSEGLCFLCLIRRNERMGVFYTENIITGRYAQGHIIFLNLYERYKTL